KALEDYQAFPDSTTPESDLEVVFAPGETTKTVYVTINGDNLVEPDEMFFANILSADNAVIAAHPSSESNHATIVMKKDDRVPTVSPAPWAPGLRHTPAGGQDPGPGGVPALITSLPARGGSYGMGVSSAPGGPASAGSDYDAVFRQLVVFGD